METIHKGVKIKSKAYQLRSGEWIPEARIISRCYGGFTEQVILGQTPLASKVVADQVSVQMAEKWMVIGSMSFPD